MNKREIVKTKFRRQIRWLFATWIIMLTGLILFKYIPMQIYGKYILYDASSHMVWTTFGLYFLWFFVDQNKTWRIPYLIFSAIVLIIMGIQRIVAGEHNEVGVMLGLVIAGIAILIPRWREFSKRLRF